MADDEHNGQPSDAPDTRNDRVKAIVREMRANAVAAAKGLAREMAEPPLEAHTVWSDGLKGEERDG